MAQAFGPNANSYLRMTLAGGGLAVVILTTILSLLYRSPAVTEVGVAKAQPIPFSHQRHVGGNGIDCRYCHTSVEDSSFAGVPPTETCMTCHSQVLVDAPLLDPVQASWKNEEPLKWVRIHDVPDFVYFDHSIHVAKGIGCTTCHGEIDTMELTYKAETLRMGWCLDCHRNPERFIRPKDEVFNVDYEAPRGSAQLELGRELVAEYDVKVGQLENCSICHR